MVNKLSTRGRLLPILVLLLMVTFIIVSCAKVSGDPITSPGVDVVEGDSYQIIQISSGVISVVARDSIRMDDGAWGHGGALYQGIREVEKRYKIRFAVPVQYWETNGSWTKEIILFVTRP